MTEYYNIFSLASLSEIVEGELYTEEWKDVPGYEGYYRVSSFGRIKSLHRLVKNGSGLRKVAEYIRRQTFDKDGYLLIHLSKNGFVKSYRVHRLVGQLFLENPLTKPEINHKKGVKTDNRLHQLEWATISENEKHSYSELGKKSSKGMLGKYGICKTSKPVLCITLNQVFVSAKHASRVMKINKRSILDNCYGKQQRAKGHIFKFV